MREAYETGPGAAPIANAETGASIASRSTAELFWRRFREDRLAIASLPFLGPLVVAADSAPLSDSIAPVHSPNEPNQDAHRAFRTPTGPSPPHPYSLAKCVRQ